MQNYNRRSNENSPGVQGLIKSFNKQTCSSDSRPQSILASDANPAYKMRSCQSPVTVAVSPIPRHHSIAVSSSNDGAGSSDETRVTCEYVMWCYGWWHLFIVKLVIASDLTQLSSLLRRNSDTHDARKTEANQQHTGIYLAFLLFSKSYAC